MAFKQKLVFLVIFLGILLLGAAFFVLQNQEPGEGIDLGDTQDLTKEDLLVKLKEAAEIEDYATFAQYLKTAYEKGWNREKDFESVESSAYVKADQTYFIPGNYQKTLEISTIVYNQVPQGWRFQYLRVLALEKLGRIALERNDFKGAENYASAILTMTFRPEGANLLADVYIQKIEESLQAGNIQEAKAEYDFVKDFEVSGDRRVLLEELRRAIR